MTWVKICGTTSAEDAALAVEAGADALGFVFWEDSPRRVTPQAARAIIAGLPEKVEKIGVFVDEDIERVWQVVEEAGLTAVQFHGHETPRLMKRFVNYGKLDNEARTARTWVLKAIPVGGEPYSALRYVNGAEEVLKAVLLDSAGGRAPGGTGKTFDWQAAANFVVELGQRFRVVLAGGLKPENVAQAIALLHPWGVDVVSGVEKEPGRKDPARVKAFVQAAKSIG
ncbi:MAG TPA: phosphoribosylanthranilate isomerase [Terriglobales bacterium]|jgi:phosphoribosylanthranilate isomerase|nr:phosphoribosylanthranilate isomerase [Terriglobales bacterium]